jgi:hypothetical protein
MAVYINLHTIPDDNNTNNIAKQTNGFRFKYLVAMSLGKKYVIAFEPSRGGIGIRFIKARTILTVSIIYKKDSTEPPNPVSKSGIAAISLTPSPEKIARNIFAAGPAKETMGISTLGFFKFLTFIGIGLAQPKKIGALMINNNAGRIILPNNSMCDKGFKVMRPNIFAVSSPLKWATYPCATS